MRGRERRRLLARRVELLERVGDRSVAPLLDAGAVIGEREIRHRRGARRGEIGRERRRGLGKNPTGFGKKTSHLNSSLKHIEQGGEFSKDFP